MTSQEQKLMKWCKDHNFDLNNHKEKNNYLDKKKYKKKDKIKNKKGN